jgi:hypothetical protein
LARLCFTAVDSKCRSQGRINASYYPTAATTYVDYLRGATIKIGHLPSKENMLWKRSVQSSAHNFRTAKDMIHISEAEMVGDIASLTGLMR